MDFIKNIYKKYEEIINYLIVGVMTTVVSLIFYYISTRTFLDPEIPIQLQIANLIKWVTGVTFAYVTNKIFVFKSKRKDYLKEFATFASSRVRTLLLDMAVMYIMVTVMGIYDLIATLVSQVLVTVGNYILSKLIVFKKILSRDKFSAFISYIWILFSNNFFMMLFILFFVVFILICLLSTFSYFNLFFIFSISLISNIYSLICCSFFNLSIVFLYIIFPSFTIQNLLHIVSSSLNI